VRIVLMPMCTTGVYPPTQPCVTMMLWVPVYKPTHPDSCSTLAQQTVVHNPQHLLLELS
jgi:hypothetical protein